MMEFAVFIKEHGLDRLPQPTKTALCILPKGQNPWDVAYSAWILSRQAGFLIKFILAEDEIPDAQLYLLPCVKESESIGKRQYDILIEKVKRGSTLYISMDERAFLCPFEEVTGVKVQSVQEKSKSFNIAFMEHTLPIMTNYIYEMAVTKAKVLALSENGEPVFFVNRLGEGTVYTLTLPLETAFAQTPDALSGERAPMYVEIYNEIKEPAGIAGLIKKNERYIAVSEHEKDNQFIIIATNCSNSDIEDIFTIRHGYYLKRVLRGSLTKMNKYQLYVSIDAADAIVFEIEKEN
jgi:hypothetical protein